jgi:hypothetical protein
MGDGARGHRPKNHPMEPTLDKKELLVVVAALSTRRVVEAYSQGGLLTNDQPEAQRKLL